MSAAAVRPGGAMCEHAITLAQRFRFSVMPLDGKEAVLKNWPDRATTDPDEIRQLWAKDSACNIGIATGNKSGVFVLDVDAPTADKPDKKGLQTLEALERKHGPLPKTWTVITGSGGQHRYFRMPDFHIGNRVAIWPGIDIRGNRGYAVAPPSIHPDTGRPYTWGRPGPEHVELAAAPDWILEALRPKPVVQMPNTRYTTSPVDDETLAAAAKDLAAAWPSAGNGRHETMLALGGLLWRARWPEEAAVRFAASVYTQIDRPDRRAIKRTEDEIRDSFCKGAAGGSVTGIPTLVARIGKAAVDRLTAQLRIEPEAPDAPAAESANYAARVDAAVQWAERGGGAGGFDGQRGLIPSLADAIMGDHHFACDAGGNLHVFTGGVYEPDGAEDLIQQKVRLLLEKWGQLPKWRSAVGTEVIQYIRVAGTPRLWAEPPLDRINVANGVLDLTTGEICPHSPEFLSAIQLPVKYDPSARCPHWERFICETLEPEVQDIAWEIAALLITPDTSHQKAILAVGDGGNGKSVYIDGLIALIGKRNVSARTLHDLEEDRFAAANLVGKLANICSDLPARHLESTAMFKAITSPDPIKAERKHHDAFTFTPFARLLFSANALPRSSDASSGFYRRWLVVPFDRSFEGSAERRNKREINAELQSPGELSGLFNRALRILPEFRRNGFTLTDSIREAAIEFRAATDPLAAWLDKRTVKNMEHRVFCKDLLFAFNDEVSKPNGNGYITQHSLTKALKTRGIEKKRGHEDYYYSGIALR